MNTPEFPPPSGEAFPNAPAPTGQALDAVKLPAIFLIVVAGFSILYAIVAIATSGGSGNEEEMARLLSNPDTPEWARSMVQHRSSYNLVLPIAWLVIDGLIVFGAVQMMRLRNFGLSMAASVLAVIPCISPCCCLGIPFGIWALVVLNKPEVKASFT